MEPATLVKTPFIPDRETVFLFDDHSNATVPTTHTAYFKKDSPFLTAMLNAFPQYYNKDCYSCSDTTLTKALIANRQFELDIGSADFCLP